MYVAPIKKKLLILEIDVGFNTRSVIQWPLEQITYQSRKANFVRINAHCPRVSDEIGEKAISLSGDAFNAIQGIGQLARVNSADF